MRLRETPWHFDPTVTPEKPSDFHEAYLQGPEPPQEKRRARALFYYWTDKSFKDRLTPIVELAKSPFDTESILVSFLDDKLMLNYYAFNFPENDLKQNESFCSHAILTPGDVFLVPDALLDWRFAGNPLVTAEGGICFYAGSPIRVSDSVHNGAPTKQAAGMMCLIDRRPRKDFDKKFRRSLKNLADLVKQQLDEALDVPFVGLLTVNGPNVVRFVWKSRKNVLTTSEPVWVSPNYEGSAMLVRILETKDRYLVVYTDDKTQVFDRYDLGYLQNFCPVHNGDSPAAGESVSHELRTPLHGILSSVELLLEDDETQPGQRGMLHVLQSSRKNLINVINGRLDFHKFETDIKVSVEEIPVVDLAQDVMDALSLSVSNGVELVMHVNVTRESEYIRTDSSLLRQTLLNVVKNAGKITKAGSVDMEVGISSVSLTCVVKDTGVGIGAEFLADGLFTPFAGMRT
ncbi:hypothetical protein HDV00_010383 [Rhizophlyctis rosea]|nr:hypothetical protein HDV00_010383 [Rhizophlyctis rosea]